MADYKERVEAEYEAIEKTLFLLPQRLENLTVNIIEVFEQFKSEIDKIIS